MIFNKEHIPLIMEQLKEEGFKPRSDPGSQYVKVDVPAPTRLQLMDIASDVDRRTKSCIGTLNKIRGNTAIRLQKAMENEFIDQRTAGMANKNIEKFYAKYERQVIEIGMLKKRDILGKWFSPDNDLEKEMYKKVQQKENKLKNREEKTS